MYIDEKVLNVRYVGFGRNVHKGLCMQKEGSDYTQECCTGTYMYSSGTKGSGGF